MTICGVRDKRFVTKDNPEGICRRKPVGPSGRCEMHGGLSTGPKTQEGKVRAMRLKTGMQYTFMLKCAICPPNLQCSIYDKERAYCPLEAEILTNPVNIQAIREHQIKMNQIILGRLLRIFAKTVYTRILSHYERIDGQLERYLNAYEKVKPVKRESFAEKLARRRKEIEKRGT